MLTELHVVCRVPPPPPHGICIWTQCCLLQLCHGNCVWTPYCLLQLCHGNCIWTPCCLLQLCHGICVWTPRCLLRLCHSKHSVYTIIAGLQQIIGCTPHCQPWSSLSSTPQRGLPWYLCSLTRRCLLKLRLPPTPLRRTAVADHHFITIPLSFHYYPIIRSPVASHSNPAAFRSLTTGRGTREPVSNPIAVKAWSWTL